MGMSSNHLNLDQLEPETPPNQEQEKKAKNRRQQQIIIRMPVLKLHRIDLSQPQTHEGEVQDGQHFFNQRSNFTLNQKKPELEKSKKLREKGDDRFPKPNSEQLLLEASTLAESQVLKENHRILSESVGNFKLKMDGTHCRERNLNNDLNSNQTLKCGSSRFTGTINLSQMRDLMLTALSRNS
ncbi:hypothetical protein FQA47_010833 [Oryzias melastigma]|uniref:Uncharacterized protein n=1 Tax=Oryzias melastigma TaxID=30732 RepID=A0A834F3M7_ORYME|nr:hypothetical protein FQA47_010833 [Oryzias melastigma]